MKPRNKVLLGSLLFALVFCLIPVTSFAVSTTLPGGTYGYVPLSGNASKGSFTATGTITAFIADSLNGGSPPIDALWQTTGMSGSWDVTFPDSAQYYLVFSNGGGSSVDIEYSIVPSIPGFEMLYALFCLIAIMALLALRKKAIF